MSKLLSNKALAAFELGWQSRKLRWVLSQAWEPNAEERPDIEPCLTTIASCLKAFVASFAGWTVWRELQNRAAARYALARGTGAEDKSRLTPTMTVGELFGRWFDDDATEVEHLTREATGAWSRWWDVGFALGESMSTLPDPLTEDDLQSWLDRLYAPIDLLEREESSLVERHMPRRGPRLVWMIGLRETYRSIREDLAGQGVGRTGPRFIPDDKGGGTFRIGEGKLTLEPRSNGRMPRILIRLQASGWRGRVLFLTRSPYESRQIVSAVSHFHHQQRDHAFFLALRLRTEEHEQGVYISSQVVPVSELKASARKYGRRSARGD